MHILGKTLLWFCMLLAVGATVLTTMTLDVRSKWIAEVEKRQNQIEKNNTRLNELRRSVRLEEGKAQSLKQEWGDVWVANNSGPQPGNPGVIEIGVGAASGIRATPPSDTNPAAVAFAFATDPNGQAQYLGEFRVVDLAAGRTAAQLVRPTYPGEVETWPLGQYHMRQTLPGNWLSTMADLEAQTVIAQARLESQQAQLATLQKQNQASQAALDQRLMELNGDPTAPPGTIPEILDGLVATVRKREADRNEQLARVDVLRLDLDDLYVRMRRLLDENRQLVQKMAATSGQPGQAAVQTADSR